MRTRKHQQYRRDLFAGMLHRAEQVELREAEDDAHTTGKWEQVRRVQEEIAALKVLVRLA